jgi:putative acetyltransferase
MQNNFSFRTATNNDYEKIVDLVKSILPEFDLTFDPENSEADLLDIEKAYINNGGTFIVLQNSQNDILGTVALLKLVGRSCKLRKMYVDKKYRGFKLGEQLMKQALNKAIELGFRTIYLETVHTMKAAIQLYEKYGFVIIPDKKADSPRCDIVMMKNV